MLQWRKVLYIYYIYYKLYIHEVGACLQYTAFTAVFGSYWTRMLWSKLCLNYKMDNEVDMMNGQIVQEVPGEI